MGRFDDYQRHRVLRHDAHLRLAAGSIANIASMMGMVGMNPWLYQDSGGVNPSPDYFFRKGGMINLTRYLASHYGPSGVRVNVVSPGGIYNAEKGGAVAFLLSDAATYITGINLPVDGGYSAK